LEQIESILSMEMEMLEERHKRGQEMFRQLAKYAPAFGMMGTLIGLIQMLKNVNDPSAIGPGMAVALLTTFYGTLVANLICLPLSGKLEKLSQNEQIAKSLVLEGIKAIQMGDSPKLVEKKLRSFLPTTLRLELDAAA
ncbi:MAG: motility protein A, partial [Gemmatimonadetes bacterium]|nr:motility protein A [Gemmatimonadota bacterium]